MVDCLHTASIVGELVFHCCSTKALRVLVSSFGTTPSFPYSIVSDPCAMHGSSFLPSLPSQPLLFPSDEAFSRQLSLTAQDQVKCPKRFHSSLCLLLRAHVILSSNFLFLICLLTGKAGPVRARIGIVYFWIGASLGVSVKESACRCRRCKFDPWFGKISWRRKWQVTPVFLPGRFHGHKSLAGCRPWGHRTVGQNLAIKQQLLNKNPDTQDSAWRNRCFTNVQMRHR